MFVTFKSSKEGRSRDARSEAMPGTGTKRKRTTVLRACNWCRQNRVRCDNGRPCENCRLRKQHCPREPTGDPKEIEYLRSRIAELEERLRATPESLGGSHSVLSDQFTPGWSWPDAWLSDPRSPGNPPLYFGPTSFVYFASRVCRNLESVFHKAALGASLKTFTFNETSGVLSDDNGELLSNPLTRRQEEFLLGLFWQSYHFVFPVVDEADFCNHYDSLWRGEDYHSSESLAPETTRDSSALADIALALCIQHTASMMSDNDPTQDVYSNRDGDWLYHRCQRALEDPKTRPSLYTLQTIIYSIVYLINSSCLDIARRSLANAVQTAYSLGLHHNYPSGSDLQLKNTQKQVWWAIYSLDCLLSFKMGQPCIINMADATIEPPDLPGPVPSEATINGPGEFSRLWYFSQYLKLLSNIRSVSSDILQNCANLMSQSGISSSVHQEPAIRQRCSAYLKESIKPLHRWAREVPSFLRLKRQGDGESFSTTNVPLDFDHYIPIWVQRQRALLELAYHNAMHSIFRLFMKIPHDIPSISPGIGATFPTTADRNDVHALDHAVASIRIIDQILSEANVLNSWHDAYHYAWDAALTVFAYTLVHPLCPYTFAARCAIDTAKSIFDRFFQHGFPTAAAASRITAEVKEVVYSHARSFKAGPRPSGPLSIATRLESPEFNMDFFKTGLDERVFAPVLEFETGRPVEVDLFAGSSALQIEGLGLDPGMAPLDDLDFV